MNLLLLGTAVCLLVMAASAGLLWLADRGIAGFLLWLADQDLDPRSW